MAKKKAATKGSIARKAVKKPRKKQPAKKKSAKKKPPQWFLDYRRLWDELVPDSGRAKSMQGELIRICGKLTREAYDNGNCNWNGEISRMWRFVGKHLDDGETFSEAERAGIRRAVATIIRDNDCPDTSGQGSPYYLLIERTVAWCHAHPKPVPVPKEPAFRR